jgi:hypothetical protein
VKVGIVGSEGAKFTTYTESRAKKIIYRLLDRPEITHVVSGGCHLGGIDIWAAEIGRELGKKVIEHRPKSLNWSTGYAPRNLLIAEDSDEIYCITVDKLPDTYIGMTFSHCYHCNTDSHVKSGGCWTVKKAVAMGKPGKIIVIK